MRTDRWETPSQGRKKGGQQKFGLRQPSRKKTKTRKRWERSEGAGKGRGCRERMRGGEQGRRGEGRRRERRGRTRGKPATRGRGAGDPHRVTRRHALPRCAHLSNGPGAAAGSHPRSPAASRPGHRRPRSREPRALPGCKPHWRLTCAQIGGRLTWPAPDVALAKAPPLTPSSPGWRSGFP